VAFETIIEHAPRQRQGQYHPWVSGWLFQAGEAIADLRLQIADCGTVIILNLKSEI
jgi:hypothetical protein